MRTTLSSGVVVWVALSFLPALADADRQIRVSTRTFGIPAVQSWTTTLPDGAGGEVQVRAEGDVTLYFPKGVVLVPTDLSCRASNEGVTQWILRSVKFGAAELRADKVAIDFLKESVLQFDRVGVEAEDRFEQETKPGDTATYELHGRLVDSGQDGVVLRVRFVEGRSMFMGDLGAAFSARILDEAIAASFARILLVGFPSDDRKGSAIYWLALCPER